MVIMLVIIVSLSIWVGLMVLRSKVGEKNGLVMVLGS